MQTKPTGTRGAAYLRISRHDQDLGSQRESIQRWLEDRGLSVRRWYQDVGARDQSAKREGFQQLLAAVQAGETDWIVVQEKDRFGVANSYEFGLYVTLLQRHDCELWSVVQGCLSACDPVTEILNAVDSVRSHDEQKARAARSLRGKILRVKHGEWQGGAPPYGYDLGCFSPSGELQWRLYYRGRYERTKILPDGRETPYDGKGCVPSRDKGFVLRLLPSRDKRRIEIVRLIFRWMATEAISVRAICARLNAEGVSPLYAPSWYSALVGGMLRNPAYVLGSGAWNKQSHGRFLELSGVSTSRSRVPRAGSAWAGSARRATTSCPRGRPARG